MSVPLYADNFNLQIDGILIPPPSSYDFTEADLVENSHRNAHGYAVWDVVRQNVGKIDLTWDNLDGERLTQIVAAIRSKKRFSATFFNPLVGQMQTRTFYPGDRASNLARFISASKYYAQLTVSFIEV